MIGGQHPRREWRLNPGGRTRTIEEAVALAREHGVEIPPDVAIFVDELGELDRDRTACGPRVDKPAGERVYWSDLVHDRTGKVPFRIWAGLLVSDEAIVAVLAHEMHELAALRPPLVAGSVSIDDFIRHTEPRRPGNLHDQAWDVADRAIDRMREEAGG